ncbi:hypothetical protein NC797_14795 [Aquibacillus sp. 3ASR75-11]|uniref:Uncharacterized protein n=1 Tax=Terrihalobacillus insolitus TaxID=2950438 RepID=A0A9X3WVV3_9BACI|nr:hypothetical protein [Terrihalobacillus insolitus]MDC3414550.1 hypothetical protein [Terrihalobacillus insolitus]MDC3425773.1 hypothetical protein [Terrihalobacillus insolitus]
MRIKQITYSLMLIMIFTLFFQPMEALADGKYPVRITNQTMVVFPVDETTIQVVQSVSFNNRGDQTEQELPIYLPEDYADLSLSDGLTEENMEKTDKGIVDVTGLKGGEEKKIVVSYKMPMFNGTSQWNLEQSYVTESLQVVIQPGVLSFNASNLVTQSELFEMNDQEFRRFTRVDAHPDVPWNLSFRLLNAAPQEDQIRSEEPGAKRTEDGIKIIGGEGFGYGKATVTVIIIIIALTAALIGLKRDLQKTTGRKIKINRSWLLEENEVLLQEILQLEKDYQAGLLTEQTYKKTKEQLRAKLIRIKTELYQESIS